MRSGSCRRRCLGCRLDTKRGQLWFERNLRKLCLGGHDLAAEGASRPQRADEKADREDDDQPKRRAGPRRPVPGVDPSSDSGYLSDIQWTTSPAHVPGSIERAWLRLRHQLCNDREKDKTKIDANVQDQ